MESVPLGASGLTVSRLGYGCADLPAEPRDDDDGAVALLRHALELGVTFFDNAGGLDVEHTERLLGRAFFGCTDEVVLATAYRPNGGSTRHGFGTARPDHLRAACDASLRRIGAEIIDLYYLRGDDSDVPVEDAVGAASGLVADGKVRAVGLCGAESAAVRRAHAVHPIAALRVELSLWSRPAGRALDVCRELGITVVASHPLGRGFLAGTTAARHDGASGGVPAVPRIAGRPDAGTRLRRLAAELGCTSGQLALAWVLAHGRDVVPIPATRDVNHLEENVAAVHVAPGPEHVRALRARPAPSTSAPRTL